MLCGVVVPLARFARSWDSFLKSSTWNCFPFVRSFHVFAVYALNSLLCRTALRANTIRVFLTHRVFQSQRKRGFTISFIVQLTHFTFPFLLRQLSARCWSCRTSPDVPVNEWLAVREAIPWNVSWINASSGKLVLAGCFSQLFDIVVCLFESFALQSVVLLSPPIRAKSLLESVCLLMCGRVIPCSFCFGRARFQLVGLQQIKSISK